MTVAASQVCVQNAGNFFSWEIHGNMISNRAYFVLLRNRKKYITEEKEVRRINLTVQ